MLLHVQLKVLLKVLYFFYFFSDLHYQPQAADPAKACKNCKNFAPKEDDGTKGDCFGHEVDAEGTCDFFEAKES